MSVPENSRTKSKLEVCVKAHDLCCYTLQITSNDKVFTPQFQRALTDRIVAVAIGIHTDCWNANNIYVRTEEDAKETVQTASGVWTPITSHYGNNRTALQPSAVSVTGNIKPS